MAAVHADVGVITAAVGSAVIELGGSRVLCAIYGPNVDSRQEFSGRGQLQCDVQYATFARRRHCEPAAIAEAQAEVAADVLAALTPAVRLEDYPKTSWAINIFVVQEGGAVLPAAINAASLALAHASVHMRGLVGASAVISTGDDMQVHPTEEAAGTALATVIVATMPALGQTCLVRSAGRASPVQVLDAVAAARKGCGDIHAHLRKVLLARAADGQL
mmetsp:Transcript_1332/g.4211  ORF Transcript_1332/g.4211 Transcript_1332/m.4211 type:complete len:218 (-) Transcript_1332:179-832(-)